MGWPCSTDPTPPTFSDSVALTLVSGLSALDCRLVAQYLLLSPHLINSPDVALANAVHPLMRPFSSLTVLATIKKSFLSG